MRGRPVHLLAATLALAAVYFAVAASGPDARGFWQDDGIYLATARALADGQGYRHPELPGRPYQTKYPVLWPALLAVALRLGDDPRLVLLPGALAAAAAVVLGGLYLRRRLGLPRPLALAATALAAGSPSILSMARFTLSDLPYGALALGALLCLDRRDPDWPAPSGSTGRLLAGAALAAAAVLVRPFGATLALAATLALLLQRRVRAALLVALVIAAGVLPWWLWQRWASTANGGPARALLIAPDAGYEAFLPGDPGEIARAVVQNATRTAFGLARFELALPDDLLTGGFTGSLAPTLLAHGVAWLVLGLAAIGAAAAGRGRERTFHLYLGLYAGLMLIWPFEPFRFLVPWSPLIPGLVLYGLWTSGARAGLAPGGVRAICGLAVALLGAAYLAEDLRIASSTEARFRVAGRNSELLAEDAAAMDALRDSTAPGDVVASLLPARVWLLTGRRGVSAWHDLPPYSIHAGAERTWRRFYLDGDPGALVARQLRAELVPAYQETAVRWLLLARERAPGPLIDFVRERPDRFALVWAGPRGTQALFAFAASP